ncbi:hypothetical protein ABK040_000307 [Willaertia magna]
MKRTLRNNVDENTEISPVTGKIGTENNKKIKFPSSLLPIIKIDNDCLSKIFTFLEGNEIIAKCSIICKEWNNFINNNCDYKNYGNDYFWKEIIIRDLGFEPLDLFKLNISLRDYYFYKIVKRKYLYSFYIKQLIKEENLKFKNKDLLFTILFNNKQLFNNESVDLIKRKIIYSVENIYSINYKLINYKNLNYLREIEESKSELESLNYKIITNFNNENVTLKQLLQKEELLSKNKNSEQNFTQKFNIYFQEEYPITRESFQFLQNDRNEGLLLKANGETNRQSDMLIGNNICIQKLNPFFPKMTSGRGKGGRGLGSNSERTNKCKYMLFIKDGIEEESEELFEHVIESGKSIIIIEKNDILNTVDDKSNNKLVNELNNNEEKNDNLNVVDRLNNNEEKKESNIENLTELEKIIKFDEMNINYYSPLNINIENEAECDANNKKAIIDNLHFAIGESKIGGYPDLPKEMIWPTDGQVEEAALQEKLIFIAQMNVKQLSFYDYDGTIPKSDNNSSGMIYFWAMKGRSGQINVNNGKIVSEVITFVSDKDIKRMGGLERRIDKLNHCECFCYPKRLKFRNVFSTVKAELDDEDFEQINEILRQKKGKLSKEDIYNLKKLWKELQFVKVKHLQQFGELLEYRPNYHNDDERLLSLDEKIFRDFEVFGGCGVQCNNNQTFFNEFHNSWNDLDAVGQLFNRLKENGINKAITPIFSIDRELLEEERDCENPYFHYACDYLELIENKEIKDGFLVVTQD